MISLREDSGEATCGPFEREIEKIFSPHGLLSTASNYEYRPEQQQMACQVARTLQSGGHLVVEAGTGVGKSLAYLIPAALHAVRTKCKAVISTHTIALQEQLMYKDIPLAQKLLPIEFEAALLKGRHNFLCGSRLDRAFSQANDLFTSGQHSELERIRDWSFATRNGSLSDFEEQPDPEVWEEVRSEPHVCTPKTCAKNPRCFYQAMRRRVLAADLVVLNHALFFTLLGSMVEERGDGILFAKDFVIFDEAHTLEDVASRHIGMEISQLSLRRSLQRLYNPRSKKGLFQAMKNGPACSAVAELIPKSDAFFERVARNCAFRRGRVFRVREAGLADASNLSAGLVRLTELLKIQAGKESDGDRTSELQEAASRLREARVAIEDFLRLEHPDHVYWVEQYGRREALCALHAAPIQLAETLGRMIFRENACTVLTSATLSVGSNDLSYFQNRVGVSNCRAVQIGSPFDYKKQMTLHLVKKMPEPKDPSYDAALEKWIAHFADQSQARAFVLFTSYQTMRAAAQALETHFADKGWNLLVQGSGMPAHRMVQEFRKNPRSVLFGVDSFWSGVDVPGEALSSVIITRLPFVTPDHPLTEARLESIEAEGGRPFEQYSLPEAILKLRQGVGRLIRAKSDSGTIVILDSRILNKPYGRAFLRALPECPTQIH
ncbi:MAG TPA: helicase C-terminal domain-containing protein [Terrimicrobiaceae bacterium]